MAPTPKATLAPQRPLRCSDAERHAVADRLRTALTDGRLTAEETGERLALAATARHRHELDALVDDLPAPADARPPLRTIPVPAALLSAAAAAVGALRHRPALLVLAVLLAVLLAAGAASLLLDGMHESYGVRGGAGFR